MVNKIWDVNSHARVIGYARVSTSKQGSSNYLKAQRKGYDRDKTRYGWTTPPFIEDRCVGFSLKGRAGLKKVLNLVRNGHVDAVWVANLDRLWHCENLRDLAKIYDAFLKHNVKLVTPDKIYDLSNCADTFSFDMEGILAKYNRRRLLQHKKAYKKNVVKKGRAKDGK